MEATRTARRGRPLAWERADAPPQRLHCRHRRECLDAAIRRGFPGFTCLGCPDAEPAGLADIAAEQDGLIELAAAVIDPARRGIGAFKGSSR